MWTKERRCYVQIPDDLMDFALPREVAKALRTTEGALAQMRHNHTGPKFIRRGRRILYRWTDVREYLTEQTS